jgi:hypothetical protein
MDFINIQNKTEDYFLNIEGKKVLIWNGYYKTYTAEYCRMLGLPMLTKETYKEYADIWLSPSRCKKVGKPVMDNEKPVGFYKIMHGYCPLYER